MERFRRVRPRTLRLIFAISAAALAAVAFRGIVLTVARLLAEAGAAAFVLEPLAKLYERKLSRAWSSLLAVLTALLGMALVAALFVPAISGPVSDLYASLPKAASYVRRAMDGAQGVLGDVGISLDSVAEKFDKAMNALVGALAGYAARMASSLARLTVVVTIGYFILRDRESIQLRCELCVPFRFRERVVRACANAQRELKMYLRGQAVISVLVGALSALGLAVAGVPAGVGLGLLTGALNVIPYFGPILACVPVTLVALTVGLPCAVAALAVLITVQQIDGLVISPRVMGGVTGFSSAFVIIAIYAAGAYRGVLGMLIALPVLILIRTCIRVFVESGGGN